MKKALWLYLMLCLVVVGILFGLGFVGVPAKAEASERLMFICLGFLIPAVFVMSQDYTEVRT